MDKTTKPKQLVVGDKSPKEGKDRRQKRSGKITIIFNPRWSGKVKKYDAKD